MARFRAEDALKALAHPQRRRMLELAWDAERTSSELAQSVKLSRPAASQHLKVLLEAGLVTVREDGPRRLYRARAEEMARLKAFLDDFWAERLARLAAEVKKGAGRDRRR